MVCAGVYEISRPPYILFPQVSAGGVQAQKKAWYNHLCRTYDKWRIGTSVVAIDKRKMLLISQGHFLQAKYIDRDSQAPSGRGERGVITGFSRQSRKRMLQLIATIVNEKPYFLTFTYGQKYPTFKNCKRDLDVFCKRLKRRFPDAAILWRVERQSRGAPHFHMLVFNIDWLDWDECRKMWLGTIDTQYADWSSGAAKCPHFDGRRLVGDRQVMYYVSKYCAKTEETYQNTLTLAAAMVCQFAPNLAAFFYRFINVTYLTVETGRHWGIVGRDYLPQALQTMLVVAFDMEWWLALRLAARTLWSGVEKIPLWNGFTLFCDDAERLLHTALAQV